MDSLQRSDGEEEDDGSLTLSPVRHKLFPDKNLQDWEGLTLPLPVTFEQEGDDGVSVSLGDLVRHMHPYCMAICVENDGREQMLPEGGILLEVVDQGENGEPILAIPDMDLPISQPVKEQCSEIEQKISDEAGVASDSSEHIVVDDEASEAPVTVTTPVPSLDVKEKLVTKGQKEEIKAKSPSRRKKRKKCKQQPEPVEGRVLRSASVKNSPQEFMEKSRKGIRKEKKAKVPKVPVAAVSPASQPKKTCETRPETTRTLTTPETSVKPATSLSPRQNTVPSETSPPHSATTAVKIPKQPAAAHDELSSWPGLASSGSPAAAVGGAAQQTTLPVSEPLPHVAPVAVEPKPKALSLEEYRRLRQQKKPVAVERQDSNSTKWPSLPELPMELPPIPCLPDPNPKDPRRPNAQAAKKEVEEIRPAWQPRGPCAPPTPEALLVPPAYMVASSSRVTSAPALARPQQTPVPETGMTKSPAVSQTPSVQVPTSTHQAATTAPTADCIPHRSECQSSHHRPSAESECPPVPLQDSDVTKRPRPGSPKSVDFSQTTALAIATPTASSPPKAAVAHGVTGAAAPPSPNNPSTLIKPRTSAETQTRCSPPSQSPNAEPTVLDLQEKPTTAPEPSRPKSPTQELVESFTSEIGELIAFYAIKTLAACTVKSVLILLCLHPAVQFYFTAVTLL